MPETVNNSNKLKIKEVKIIDHICDNCRVGKMEPTGITLTSMPPKYEHRCPCCNTRANLSHNYPRVVFVIGGNE